MIRFFLRVAVLLSLCASASALVITTPVNARNSYQSYGQSNQHFFLDKDTLAVARFTLTPVNARQADLSFITHGIWSVSQSKWMELAVIDTPRGNSYDASYTLNLPKGQYDFGLNLYGTSAWRGKYSFSLTAAPAVPEPETWALAGIGLVGVMLRRRFAKR